MNRIRRLLTVMVLAGGLAGCAKNNLSPRDNLSPKDNVSPKLEQDIQNQNGRIDRIESNQNAIKLAIERRVENTNTGVQVLQGEGGLLLGFGIVAILAVTGYFYLRSLRSEQAARMMADQIRAANDPALEEAVLRACMYTPAEREVYRLVTKPSP